MKIREIICERVSDILYHATSFKSAKNIISNDLLKSPTGYISFTRSLTGSYHSSNKLIGIIFEVNGSKLNQKYKGYPVGTERWDFDDNLTHHGKENKQLEDRVVAPNGIVNFLSYIKSTIIFTPYEYIEQSYTNEFGERYDIDLKYYEDTVNLLDKNNIPYRLVTTEPELYTRGISKFTDKPKDNTIKYKITIGIYDERTNSELLKHFTVSADNEDVAEKHGEDLVNKLNTEYNNKDVYLKRIKEI